MFVSNAFTAFHVLISLLALAAGFIAVGGMLAGRFSPSSNPVFLLSTIITSVTGFLFPFTQLLPSHIVGMLSLAVLAVAAYAWWGRKLEGRWRAIYVVAAVAALYFNAFVLVVQTFLKNPALSALAPTQSEPTFVIAQAIVLLAVLSLGFLALRRAR